jgi:uncharacterized repeat protein (TIGR01451 family)
MKTPLRHYALIVRALVGNFLARIFGEVAWRKPAWLRSFSSRAASHPRSLLAWMVGLIILFASGAAAWNWYEHLPKPITVAWSPHLSELPAPSDQFHPQMLTLTFERSVARLENIGKEMTRGITLSPPMAGKWIWSGGSELVFEPSQDWPAGKTYDIRLDPSLFSPHVRLENMEREFQTVPFAVGISDLDFYINPKDPAQKQITATLTFSHPVDHQSLERTLQLSMQGAGDLGRCSITYALRDRVAYIRSANLNLPKESAHATLTVPDSVATSLGGEGLEETQTGDVLVPSLYNLFHIAGTSTAIVTNKAGEPEQILLITTSVGAKSEKVAKQLRAWVLPKRKPDANGNAQVWDTAAEVDQEILARGASADLTLIPGEQDYATVHSFRLKVPENSYLYVQVDKGLAGIGSFVLADKYTAITRLPAYPRAVRIQHDGSLLALSGERKLSIMSRGVEELEFRLGRVTPGAINHLVSQSEGTFQSPVFSNYQFDETNITEQIVRRQPLAASDTSKSDYSALDFSEFFNDTKNNHGKLGLFFLHVLARTSGDDNAGFYQEDGTILAVRKPGDPYSDDTVLSAEAADHAGLLQDRRLILVTDLGLLVKDNADGTHDVFVQSIKTGQPVGGAKIEVLGKNGIPVATAQTDDDGSASLPSLADFTREKQPVAYVAHLGDDVSFLPFGREDRELNFSRFDTAGVTGLAPHDLTAFIFTDRGIYRPGDEAKIGLIIKQRDWRGKLDGVPLRLDAVDPRGTVVQSRTLKLNSSGFLEAAFATRDNSLTGKYQVNCYFAKGKDDDTLLGSLTLRVAEFLPDRMKIKATLSVQSPEGWVPPAGLQGLVSLENLYGTPSVGHRVTGKVTLNPSQFSFDRYPDYSFIDPYLNPNVPRKSVDVDLPEQKTDDQGAAAFDLSMPDLGSSAYQLTFLAEGFEKEGGRSVTAGASVLVSPRAWLVGVKPDGDFGYVQLGSKRSARFIAVDPQLHSTSAEHLKLKLAERRYVSVLVQKPNGNYGYESVLKEIPVRDQEIAIPTAGLDWPLETSQPGDFAARLYDDHGDLVADVRYTVAGAGNLTRSLEKNAELTVKLSKPEYQPGETIEAEITAPYTGAGLITIERDKVYAHAWFQAKTTSTVQKITLPKDFEGNGYLNVAFVRALDSKEIYLSPLSYAVVPFKVNQEARHTQISIDIPKLARPDESLPMVITASRPTQAVIYAVDEGILQVARYSLPDPLGYFFRKQALEVGTRQTVDLILPEYSIDREVAAAGGDEGNDALSHHLNPFKRKHDAPVAYWSGILDIGPQAKTFTYHLPDYFAGTIRVMVVANTADAVGSAQATTQVRGPFVISPNVPTFVAPGDTFDVSTTVANNIPGSGATAQVNVAMQVSNGLEMTQKSDAAITILEGRDATVHWLLRANDLLGNADITITAQAGSNHASLVSHLSIRPPVPYLTTLTSGYFRGDHQQVALDRKLYPEFRKVIALASPVPQGLTRGLGDYLEHYEFGCTEQLVSKAFPSLVTDETMQQGLPRSEVAKKVQEIVAVAASRQNDQGAFGLWQVEPNAHFDLPSVHVVRFLTEAKEQGYDVPPDLLTSGLRHLQAMADETPATVPNARNQAYAIYLLARNGTVVTNALEQNHHWFEIHLKDKWQDDVADVYEAATYALLKDQDQADAMIKRFHLHAAQPIYSGDDNYDDYNDALGRAAQYIDLLALHFPDRLRTLSPEDLNALADPIMAGDFNTLSAAEAITALNDYALAMKEKMPPGAVTIDQIIKNATKPLPVSSGFYPEAIVEADADALVFHRNTGDQAPPGLFYQISQNGFDHETITTPLSQGIEVAREYRDKTGNPTTTAQLGDELTVVLRVRSTDDRDVENVAIEDLLPGGFEIVPESAHTGDCEVAGIDYEDVREDRLLAFGSVTGTETEITYRIKATNAGTYVIPPVQAEAMYHLKIRARGVSGTLTVHN